MSGTGANLPVRIQVEGGAQAEATFNAVAATGERAMRRVGTSTEQAAMSGGQLRQAVGNAGYQIQDFAVQVQGGTSALTALSQQGSQFLGAFGPAGAIAGAILTVGILAAKFLDIAPGIETATEATNRHRDAIAASNELYETAIDKANRLTRARVAAAQAGLEERLTAERAALRAVNDEARGVTRGNLADEAERAATGGGEAPAQTAAVTARLRQEALNRAQQAQEISDRIAELDAEIARIAALPTNPDQFGPNAPGGGGGSGNPSPEDLRRQIDQRYAIQRDYQVRVDQLRDMARTGAMEEGEVARLEAAATTMRNEALERLDRPSGGGRAARPDRPGIDVQGVLAAGVRESTDAFNAFNEALNLNEAGLSGAQGALNRYDRDMQMLETALARGVITEDQFTAAVEGSTLALGRQIEEVQRRSVNTDALGRELGMTFSSAFEDAIVKGAEFSDVLKGIEQDLARLVIRQAITAPLAGAISGAVKGIDFGNIFTNLFPQRADGGPVSMGTTYLVGERGPELFTPGASGAITPNHALGGGQAITYAPTIHVDARGSDANTLARARMEAQAISQATIAQFADSIQRGGGAARLVGRR